MQYLGTELRLKTSYNISMSNIMRWPKYARCGNYVQFTTIAGLGPLYFYHLFDKIYETCAIYQNLMIN